MIYAYCGKLGHGKSFTQLEHVLELAEKQNRFVVANIPLNIEVLEKYAFKRKQYRNYAKFRRGHLFYETDFDRIMSYENAIILADEMGIFLDSRGSVGPGAEKRRKFLSDLILSRKAGLDLCWVSQDMEMVDRNVRRLTNYYFHTINTNPSKRKDPMRRRIILQFDATGYEKWSAEKTMKSYLRNALTFLPMVKPFDQNLFGAYDTLHRLDDSVTHDLQSVAAELGGHVEGDPFAPVRRDIIRVPKDYKPGQGAPKPASAW